MIQKGAKGWNDGLRYACAYGHKSMVLLMIRNGANTNHYYVTYSKHRDLILYLLDHGIPRSQLSEIPEIKQCFQEIETRKKHMMNVLDATLIVDVCRLIAEYMIL